VKLNIYREQGAVLNRVQHFVRLRCFIQDLSTSGNGEGSSEQIREGAQEKNMPFGVFLFQSPLTKRHLTSGCRFILNKLSLPNQNNIDSREILLHLEF